jgi:5'-methylthioadenosine phosphorylase
MAIGIIGGTGLYSFGEGLQLGKTEEIAQETVYGSARVFGAELDDLQLYFLPRHGTGHTVPPHRINYRANIKALADLDCQTIIATNAVGSLRVHMPPGDFVVPDDYIDATRQRPLTFFDGDDGNVVHIDQTTPYCADLRRAIIAAGGGMEIHPAGTYICTEGPRFETPAEIEMYAQWGADVVGMTGVPEVVLACELGISYATICVVTNYAAGISGEPLTELEVTEMMALRTEALRTLIADTVRALPE